MPASVKDPVVGYLTFCAVKFAGYSALAEVLSTSYERMGEPTHRSAFVIGGVRTLIGMAAGAAYYFLWEWASQAVLGATFTDASVHTIGYLAGLLPVRLAEWWLLVWLFYDRSLRHTDRNWNSVALGTLCSYLLDLPAAFGFFITTVSVC